MKLTNKDKKQIRIWVDALRSGKYAQASGCLQASGGFCCLGVACEVLIPDVEKHKTAYGGLAGAVPSQQRSSPKWLLRINAEIKDKIGVGLITLNDTKSAKFKEIADLVEGLYLEVGE